MKKAFTIVEIIIVFLLILFTAYLTVPSLLDDTKQAEYISKWKYLYSDMESMFFLLKEQNNTALKQKMFANNNNSDKKEQILIEFLQPYLRITNSIDVDKYKTYYLDSTPVRKGEYYEFSHVYDTTSNILVGLKYINSAAKNEPILMISYDVNGLKKPNTWGKDIFAIEVFTDKVQPMGKAVEEEILQQNCSPAGKGTYCSYFYIIGGNFN